MRHQGNPGRRPRGRTHRKQNVPLRAQTFDSQGPDVRVRGNANQVYEKYSALARDAAMSGDRILAESYAQFAEHYYRILNESTDPNPRRPQPEAQANGAAQPEAREGEEEGGRARAAEDGQDGRAQDGSAQDSSAQDSGPQERGGQGRGRRDNGEAVSSGEEQAGETGEEASARAGEEENQPRRKPRSRGPRRSRNAEASAPAPDSEEPAPREKTARAEPEAGDNESAPAASK